LVRGERILCFSNNPRLDTPAREQAHGGGAFNNHHLHASGRAFAQELDQVKACLMRQPGAR
jgi:hypothetical protein